MKNTLSTFTAAQSIWDNMLPPEYPDDPDPSTLDIMEATEEALRDVNDVGLWLADNGRLRDCELVDVAGLGEDLDSATVDQLFALLLLGTDAQALQARFILRERFTADRKADIHERALQILAQHAEEDPYYDDPHHWY
jgi:hypothetical protein